MRGLGVGGLGGWSDRGWVTVGGILLLLLLLRFLPRRQGRKLLEHSWLLSDGP